MRIGRTWLSEVRTQRPRGKGLWTRSSRTRGLEMPVWAWILIILLIVFALGGFGYFRR